MKYILFLLSFAFSLSTFAQDLQCNVQVNSDNIQASNKAIFEDLQNAITQFMNQRKWISDKVQPQEKINCNFVINIKNLNIDRCWMTNFITYKCIRQIHRQIVYVLHCLVINLAIYLTIFTIKVNF